MIIKICFNNEIHRITMELTSIDELREHAQQIFKNSNSIPARFNFEYIDSEGDRITISNNEEYEFLLESETDQGNPKKSVKLYLVPQNQKPQPSAPPKEEFKISDEEIPANKPADEEEVKNEGNGDDFKAMVDETLKQSVPLISKLMTTIKDEYEKGCSQQQQQQSQGNQSNSQQTPFNFNFGGFGGNWGRNGGGYGGYCGGFPGFKMGGPFGCHAQRGCGPFSGGRGGCGGDLKAQFHPFAKMMAQNYENMDEQTKKQLNEALGGKPEEMYKRFKEREESEMKKEQNAGKYSEEVRKLADQMKEIFSNDKDEDLLNFVNANPGLSFEELVANHFH